MPATRTMKNSSRLLAEIDRNRTLSSTGWPGLTDSSSTRRLKCSQDSSRLMKRSGLAAIGAVEGGSDSLSFKTAACAKSMRSSIRPDQLHHRLGHASHNMGYGDGVSMTLRFLKAR